jgi:hypothetical protein
MVASMMGGLAVFLSGIVVPASAGTTDCERVTGRAELRDAGLAIEGAYQTSTEPPPPRQPATWSAPWAVSASC